MLAESLFLFAALQRIDANQLLFDSASLRDKSGMRKALLAGADPNAAAEKSGVAGYAKGITPLDVAGIDPQFLRILLIGGADAKRFSDRPGYPFPLQMYIRDWASQLPASSIYHEGLRLFVLAGGHLQGKAGATHPQGVLADDTLASLSLRNRDETLLNLIDDLGRFVPNSQVRMAPIQNQNPLESGATSLNFLFFEAIYNGDLANVRRYLLRGADPNYAIRKGEAMGWVEGFTPIDVLGAKNEPEILRLLLLAGADAKHFSSRINPYPVAAYLPVVHAYWGGEKTSRQKSTPKLRQSLELFVLAGGHLHGTLGYKHGYGHSPQTTLYTLARGLKDQPTLDLIERLDPEAVEK